MVMLPDDSAMHIELRTMKCMVVQSRAHVCTTRRLHCLRLCHANLSECKFVCVCDIKE